MHTGGLRLTSIGASAGIAIGPWRALGILYEAERNMTRGEAELVTAAVTLNHTIPRDQILRRKGVTESQGLLVSCRLQARLLAYRGSVRC